MVECKSKNILITGGIGFIGSHLTKYLVKNYRNYNIIVLDKLDYCSNLKNIDDIKEYDNFKLYIGDILDINILKKIFSKERIDTVMHLAAYTHVDHSFQDSIKFTENNVLGTHYLLECSREFNVLQFIYVSTDEVYGSGQSNSNTESNESTIVQPTNPYSASKAAAELLVLTYKRSFSLPTIITRGNNVYGPFQYPEKIIPKFITSLAKGNPCTIHGNGKNLRSFIYISDMISAFDIILHKGEIGEIYNIGTEFEISNLDLAEQLVGLFNINSKNKNEMIQFIKDRPFNDFRYRLNCNKLKSLGWSQKITWDSGIKETLNWYLNNLSYWNNNSSSSSSFNLILKKDDISNDNNI